MTYAVDGITIYTKIIKKNEENMKKSLINWVCPLFFGLFLVLNSCQQNDDEVLQAAWKNRRPVTTTTYRTISFDANGGTGTMEPIKVKSSEISNKILTPNTFTKYGYIFDKWNTEADGSGTNFEDGSFLSDVFAIGNDIVLYAVWKSNEFIVFDLSSHNMSELSAYLSSKIDRTSTENGVSIVGGEGLTTEDLKTLSDAIKANSTYIGTLDLSELKITEMFNSGSGAGNAGIFDNLTALKELILPKTLVILSEGAFAYCKKLEKVTMYEGVTSILWSAFAYCEKLKTITIPDSVELIDQTVFYECKALRKVEISKNSNLRTIGMEAFLGCSSLQQFYVPKKVLALNNHGTDLDSSWGGKEYSTSGNGAFYSCTSLKSITFENTLTKINGYTFEGCSALTDIYYTGTEAEWNAVTIGAGNDYIISATKHYNFTE